MIPGSANPSPQLRGDTWQGWPSITIDPAPGVALESAKMDFRNQQGQIIFTLSTEDESMTIVNASTTLWVLSVPARKLDAPADNYNFDLQTTATDGTIRTYWRGILPLQQDITQ